MIHRGPSAHSDVVNGSDIEVNVTDGHVNVNSDASTGTDMPSEGNCGDIDAVTVTKGATVECGIRVRSSYSEFASSAEDVLPSRSDPRCKSLRVIGYLPELQGRRQDHRSPTVVTDPDPANRFLNEVSINARGRPCNRSRPTPGPTRWIHPQRSGSPLRAEMEDGRT